MKEETTKAYFNIAVNAVMDGTNHLKMDISFYLNKFRLAANKLDKRLLTGKQIQISVVTYGEDCVVLKLYKTSWANKFQDPLISESRIFFSVWISDSSLKERKLLYNIHALKLRQLKGYSIQSRRFAEIFRSSFKAFQHKWISASVDFGPLTLMEGWINIDVENFQDQIVILANNFLEIEHLVDETLTKFK